MHLLALLAACQADPSWDEVGSPPATTEPQGFFDLPDPLPGPETLWVLVHFGEGIFDPGIFLVDTEQQTVLTHLPLPDDCVSPHGLYDAGTHLLLTSKGDDALYLLDRTDGHILDRIAPWYGEGLASDGTSYFTLGEGVQRYDLDLALLETMEVPYSSGATDLAWVDGALYALINSAPDQIDRLDPDTLEWERVSARASFANTSYAMVAWDRRFLVADSYSDASGRNYLHHLDREMGSSHGITELPVHGWVTALALPAE